MLAAWSIICGLPLTLLSSLCVDAHMPVSCVVLHELQQPWLLSAAEGTVSISSAAVQCGGHASCICSQCLMG